MKHTEAIPDPRAVNQDKKNTLFSVFARLYVVEKLLFVIMVAIWNRADHCIFALWFLSFFLFFFLFFLA